MMQSSVFSTTGNGLSWSQKWIPATIAFCVTVCSGSGTTYSAEPTAAHLLPKGTVVYAELSDPKQLIATIWDHPLRTRIQELPPIEQLLVSEDFAKFTFGRELIESHFAMSWRELLETAAAQGVAAAFDPESQGVALIVRGRDADSMSMLMDKAVLLAQMGANGKDLQKAEYRDVKAYRLNELRFAVHSDTFILTNQSELGKTILDNLIDGAKESLLDNPRFQSALATRDDQTSGWAFADVEVIRESGVADNVYEDQINNPVLELLVGGIQSTLQHTPLAAFSMLVESNGVQARLAMPLENEWIPEQREYYFGADGKGHGPNLVSVPGTVMTLSTHRDFAQMWLRAGDLFDDRVNDEFAKADATLTTIFAGRDFGEDILGAINPEVGLVVARQDFGDRLPRPAIKIPEFALVATLREPEIMTRDLRRTFQTLIGFFNVVGAMNGQTQLELGMEDLGEGAQLVTSQYVPEPGDENSDAAKILFNFSPTVGFNGERFVLASTMGLARRLTTAATPDPATLDANSAMTVSASGLQSALQDNREQLIAQNMLEEGNGRDEAEAAIDLLLTVVGFLESSSLQLKADDAELAVEFDLKVGAE
ncbi:hypothetical protein [Stieleria varia]|uniref:DUF3352 domain-containing protein n=1 Tax=Stieleria varia TaxID=2528005 RepID=A0A5C6AT54_9BACT|nr:hypothetical protein [Stieleria varia]TWU01324.1 hypothetical protein Pla52n_46980 [Stieleria varia]